MTGVRAKAAANGAAPLDALDWALVAATESGLPLLRRPFAAVAEKIGCSEAEAMERFARMLARGQVRRIAAVPNHYEFGIVANGMTVWDIVDEEDPAAVDRAGRALAALPAVSHCYHRPRRLPDWPYNLFAMVHGKSQATVLSEVEHMAALLGAASRGHKVLFSTRILKKTGFRGAAG